MCTAFAPSIQNQPFLNHLAKNCFGHGFCFMITRAQTVTFEGMEPRELDVECSIGPRLPGFVIVGLPDKAVSEARDRIRAVLNDLSLALLAKKITINFTPADLTCAFGSARSGTARCGWRSACHRRAIFGWPAQSGDRRAKSFANDPSSERATPD